MRTARSEFPSYPFHLLPEIPSGWVDDSWHNDVCPSWIAGAFRDDAATLVKVYVDWPLQEDRELRQPFRFMVLFEQHDGQSKWQDFNDWDSLVSTVASLNLKPYSNPA